MPLSQAIVDIIKNCNNGIVDLSTQQIGPTEAHDIGLALQGTQVHTLILWDNWINAAGAQALGLALRLTQVRTLDLSANKIRANGAKDLGEALHGTQVQTLNLSHNKITGIEAKELAITLRRTRVNTLELRSNKINAAEAKDLGEALQGTQIHTLDLYGNRIAAGAKELAIALRHTRVHTLLLGDNQISATDAIDLAVALRDTHVQTLSLSRNNIVNEAATIAFARALQDTLIHTLAITGNCITDTPKRLAEGLQGTRVTTVFDTGNAELTAVLKANLKRKKDIMIVIGQAAASSATLSQLNYDVLDYMLGFIPESSYQEPIVNPLHGGSNQAAELMLKTRNIALEKRVMTQSARTIQQALRLRFFARSHTQEALANMPARPSAIGTVPATQEAPAPVNGNERPVPAHKASPNCSLL